MQTESLAETLAVQRFNDERRAIYGHGSTYTPATDGCPVPFKPSADRYSPPATTATGRPIVEHRPVFQNFPFTK